jgi:hypothetical protein
MRTTTLVTSFALIAIIQGCATMNQEECLVSDWQTIGYEDGVQGRTGDRIGTYRKACAKHGVSPDFESYQAGRTEGLKEFCQPDNGFEYGAKGNSYRGVCPADLADEFVAAYQNGRKLYELESGVRSATRQLSARRKRLDQIDEVIGANSVRLVSDGATSSERVNLLIETNNLAEERGRVKAEIDELIEEKATLDEKLRNYREGGAATS